MRNILQCSTSSFLLSDEERDVLFKHISRKIDRVGYNLFYNQPANRRAVLIANCKLVIHVFLHHTDKSLTLYLSVEDLSKLTDIHTRALYQILNYLTEMELLSKNRSNGMVLLAPPPSQPQLTIYNIYAAIVASEQQAKKDDSL